MTKKTESEDTSKSDSQPKAVVLGSMARFAWLNKKVLLLAVGFFVLAGAVWIGFKFLTNPDAGSQDQTDEASELSQIELRQRIIDNPETVQYTDYIVQAINYWFEGDLDKAFENYAKADELEPDRPEILTAMALIKREARDAEAAIDYFNQAITSYGGSDRSAVEKLNKYIELTQNGDFTMEVEGDDSQSVPQ